MASQGELKDRIRNKITPEKGFEYLDKILKSGQSGQFIVSPGNITGMLDDINDFLLNPLKDKPAEKQNAPLISNRPDIGITYTAPVNTIEEKIVSVMQNVLGINPIGIHDDFFALGGNSLLAITLISELSKSFDKNISLQDLFDKPTISLLSELITEQPDEDDFEEGKI